MRGKIQCADQCNKNRNWETFEKHLGLFSIEFSENKKILYDWYCENIPHFYCFGRKRKRSDSVL